jgi:hypothetical protein
VETKRRVLTTPIVAPVTAREAPARETDAGNSTFY